ncbi:ATP-dependent RNA helicase RhlB, partial [Pseudomonas syringae]|nr:ATP-dependent RNA helicase RhlB [Pseudomonas syringae]
MLKALKKMFGKSEAEQRAPIPTASIPASPPPVTGDQPDHAVQTQALDTVSEPSKA